MNERQRANLFMKNQMAAAQAAQRYAAQTARATEAVGEAAEAGGKALDTRAGRTGTQSYALPRAGAVMGESVMAPARASVAALRRLNRRRRGAGYQRELGGTGGDYTGFIAGGGGTTTASAANTTQPAMGSNIAY